MKPRRKIEPWLFLLPALVTYIAIVLFPMIQTISYSFMNWNGIGEKTFAGFENYRRMLSDKNLRTAFFNNLYFLLIGTVFQMVMGLLMATLLSGIKKDRTCSACYISSHVLFHPWQSVRFLKNCCLCNHLE